MLTLPRKADKIHKLAAQLQYNVENWGAHHRPVVWVPTFSAGRLRLVSSPHGNPPLISHGPE